MIAKYQSVRCRTPSSARLARAEQEGEQREARLCSKGRGERFSQLKISKWQKVKPWATNCRQCQKAVLLLLRLSVSNFHPLNCHCTFLLMAPSLYYQASPSVLLLRVSPWPNSKSSSQWTLDRNKVGYIFQLLDPYDFFPVFPQSSWSEAAGLKVIFNSGFP